MRFGVNYTPSNGWFHSWLHPDWDSVSQDLDAIAGLGMDHIRIFPLWPILQPNRTWINEAALDDVRHMTQLADERGLDVFSDVLQGHLSSFDFVPSWLVSWHETSMFTDPNAIAAEARLVSAVYAALEDIGHFQGLTLGNECNQFADRVHPRRMDASSADIDGWLNALLAPIRDKANRQGRVLLHSENDAVWYADHHAFMPCHAAGIGDITAIHSWVFNGTAQRYGGLSQESTRHGEYLIELSKAFADSADHPVWLQEIGAPGNVIAAADMPRFCSGSIEHAADCTNLYGITWWCSHDVNHALSDFPPFEHDLGLFDENGALKPIGRQYAKLADEYRRRPEPSPRSTAVVVQVGVDGNPTLKAACSPGGSVFERWMALSAKGERPAIISSITAGNPQALALRGISNYEQVEMVAGNAYSAVSDPSLEAAMASAS